MQRVFTDAGLHTLLHHAANGTLKKICSAQTVLYTAARREQRQPNLPNEAREAMATIECKRELWAARRI